LQLTTDSSETATAVVPVECTSARAVLYSNFNTVDPGIDASGESSVSDRDEAFVGVVIPHSPSLAEDFNRVQEDRDVDRLHRKPHEVKVEEVLPDARLDHPTSTEEVQYDDEKQRPTRAARRPARFLDRDFETQFRPEERKKCSRLGRGDQARCNIDKFYNFYKHRKKREWYNHLGRGDQQSAARRMTDSSTQSTSPSQPSKEGRKPLLDGRN